MNWARAFSFCISATTLNVISSTVVAKKEASLRKRLKFAVLFSKPDENGLLEVCTIYFRQEEVLLLVVRTEVEAAKQQSARSRPLELNKVLH